MYITYLGQLGLLVLLVTETTDACLLIGQHFCGNKSHLHDTLPHFLFKHFPASTMIFYDGTDRGCQRRAHVMLTTTTTVLAGKAEEEKNVCGCTS